jgi:hypothetical protein
MKRKTATVALAIDEADAALTILKTLISEARESSSGVAPLIHIGQLADRASSALDRARTGLIQSRDAIRAAADQL